MAKYKKRVKYEKGGDLTQYNGYSHEMGGIPIGQNNEVEGGETRGMPDSNAKDYIFSDKLRVPGQKYTFAKKSKMIENRLSKRVNDKLSAEQKEREINDLMNSQEQVRSTMMDKAYKKAYGGKLNQYKNGGKFWDGAKDLGLFAADTALSGLAPNLIKQSDYDSTGFGKTLGDVSTIHEGFSNQSPLAKATSKLKIGGEQGAGMTEHQKELYNKTAAISKPISGAFEQVVGTVVPITKPLFSAANSLDANPSGQIPTGNEDQTAMVQNGQQIGNQMGNMMDFASMAGSFSRYGGNLYAKGGELRGPGGKYGSFNPQGSGIHQLQPGEQPLTPAQLEELGFAPITANSAQEGMYPRGRYKSIPYNATASTNAVEMNAGNVTPVLNHSKQMDTNPEYRKAYFAAHPELAPERHALGGGLNRSEDYGTEKKPYPSVQSNDFAGGNRSYPIPTKADAVDALRLAGLHGRSDVKAKVYSKYPELKHRFGGPKGGDGDIPLDRDTYNYETLPSINPGQITEQPLSTGPDQMQMKSLPVNSYQAPQTQYDPFANSLKSFDVTKPGNQFQGNTGTFKSATPAQGQYDFGPGKNYLGADANSETFSTQDAGTKGFDPNMLYNAGNFLGAGYDIYRGLKGGDDVNYDRVTPDEVSYQTSRDLARRDIKEGFSDTKNSLKGINSPQQYLKYVTQAAGQRDKTLSDSIARSYENEANTNAQLRNQGKYFNAQTQRSELDARQLEKDQASNTLQAGLAGTGSAIAGTGRDVQSRKSQEEAEKFIRTGDYTPTRDERGKILYIKNNKGEIIQDFRKG